MTLPQILSLAELGGMMQLFIRGRIRYDKVAVLALLVSLLVGIVKPKHAFSGFSDDIVIIVASALGISAAVERSGVVEAVISRLTNRASKVGSQLAVLVGSVTLL